MRNAYIPWKRQAVGILGTDGTSRSLPNLLAKVRALDREGCAHTIAFCVLVV